MDEFYLNNLLPLMKRALLKDIYSSVYIFGDVSLALLAVGFLYPMLDSRKKLISLSVWAMLTGGILVVIWPIFEIGVMGPHVMERYVFCCMEQIRSAELTKYFTRAELLMVILFTAGCIVQSSVMFYCAKAAIKQAIGINKEVFVIIPLFFALVAVTYFMGVDHLYYSNFLAFPWAQISAALGVGIPCFLLLTGLLRGKLKNKERICPSENLSSSGK